MKNEDIERALKLVEANVRERAAKEAKVERPQTPYPLHDSEWRDGFIAGVIKEATRKREYLRIQCQ